MTRDECISTINACKSFLAQSDYEIIKLAEGMTDCTTMAQLSAFFAQFRRDFGELVVNRRKWRARVDEALRILDELPDEPEIEDEPEIVEESEEDVTDVFEGDNETADVTESAEVETPEENESAEEQREQF